jgi:NTE family protein
VIAPSSEIFDKTAIQFAKNLPRSIRSFVAGSGVTKQGGAGVLSYLLFDGEYCKALIDIGYADGMARANEIRQFLGLNLPNQTSNVCDFLDFKHRA